MRIKSFMLGASAMLGLSALLGNVSAAVPAMIDTGRGTPAYRSRGGSRHRHWQRARASGRHDFRRAL